MTSFSELTSTWNGITSHTGKSPFAVQEIITYIQDTVKSSGTNAQAITVVDLRSNHYLYIDPRIHQVTGYTKEEYQDKGPRFLFSKIPLSHKVGVIKSTIHQNRFISKLGKEKAKDFISCREYHVYDKYGLKDCDDPDCISTTIIECNCTDGIDNDGNGYIDCADFFCSNVCPCIECDCTDGIDNDGDGLIDCVDPDCAADIACI